MKAVLLFSVWILVSGKMMKHLEEQYETCCPETYVVDPVSLHCVCPFDQPFINADNRCVACTPPYIWNPSSRQCETCPPNSWWDNEQSGCIGCPAGFLTVDKQCICP